MRHKKATVGMSDADYHAMCERMIVYAQRGRKEQEIVKSVAKAGNVTPVLEYVDKFRKMFTKFQLQQKQNKNGKGDE
jgi:hypothetical protein